MLYVIRNIKNCDEFWCNVLGWVGVDSATYFETKQHNLPIEGEWVEISDPIQLTVLRCVADNPTVTSIIDDWRNGNKKDALNAIWFAPPHIAAQVILQLRYSVEADQITNLLVERFIEWRDEIS